MQSRLLDCYFQSAGFVDFSTGKITQNVVVMLEGENAGVTSDGKDGIAK